jgi:hypothetical protein
MGTVPTAVTRTATVVLDGEDVFEDLSTAGQRRPPVRRAARRIRRRATGEV